MKLLPFYLALGFCLLSMGPALARDGWTAPMNGTVSAIMMPSGAVMMKIIVPPAELEAIARNMKTSHDTCIIERANPGKAGYMELVCGPTNSMTQ